MEELHTSILALDKMVKENLNTVLVELNHAQALTVCRFQLHNGRISMQEKNFQALDKLILSAGIEIIGCLEKLDGQIGPITLRDTVDQYFEERNSLLK